MSDDVLIMGCIAYDDDADIDLVHDDDGNPRVGNHDELVIEGKTMYEYRAIEDNEQNRSILSDSVIIESGDSEWREEFANLEVGDTRTIIE